MFLSFRRHLYVIEKPSNNKSELSRKGSVVFLIFRIGILKKGTLIYKILCQILFILYKINVYKIDSELSIFTSALV